jgi:hypothetical protein
VVRRGAFAKNLKICEASGNLGAGRSLAREMSAITRGGPEIDMLSPL